MWSVLYSVLFESGFERGVALWFSGETMRLRTEVVFFLSLRPLSKSPSLTQFPQLHSGDGQSHNKFFEG